MGITNEELAALEATKNETEWNNTCDAIKAAHGGYPADWWPKVMMSGLAARVAQKWGKPDAFEIKVETISEEDLRSGKW